MTRLRVLIAAPGLGDWRNLRERYVELFHAAAAPIRWGSQNSRS